MEKINAQSIAEHHPCVYGYNSLVMFTDFASIKISIDETFYIEGVLVVLINKGHASVEIDGEVCDYYEGDLFACRPNVMVENAMVSVDMDAIVLFISPDYALDLVSKSGVDWTYLLINQKHESIHLSQEQMNLMTYYFLLLHSVIESTETPYKSKRIGALMITLIYTLCDLISSIGTCIHNQTYSPKDNLMERFFYLLADSNPQKGYGHHYLSVTEYANKLYVTPKYFSMVCKKTIGKPAGQIINEEIIRSAQALLHDNQLSVKQISKLLGFTNQSHFGTFFRRHTRLSPTNYRNVGMD